jgi:succinate dehydrogenase/fumarate reductase flavoprotein subunit
MCCAATKSRHWPSVDVLVVGAGSAGCVAALAARESGEYSVALVERYGFAGWHVNANSRYVYGFFTPGDEPRKVVGGLPDAW